MSRTSRAVRLLTIVALTAAAAACSNPRQLAYLNDELNQAAQAVAGLRVEIGTLETSLDSLRTVVAKQDSTIQKLATATNVQIVK
jgi:uncharacterized protein YlxW (UPF0749 family)